MQIELNALRLISSPEAEFEIQCKLQESILKQPAPRATHPLGKGIRGSWSIFYFSIAEVFSKNISMTKIVWKCHFYMGGYTHAQRCVTGVRFKIRTVCP